MPLLVMNIYSGVNLHMYLVARETYEACERYMSYAFRLAHSWSYGISRWNRNYRLGRSETLCSKPETEHSRDLLLRHTFFNTTTKKSRHIARVCQAWFTICGWTEEKRTNRAKWYLNTSLLCLLHAEVGSKRLMALSKGKMDERKKHFYDEQP